ncbi:hypothetical protein N7451_012246 [Penicillium sp. IBT 35674x]|nr:hypothetical protein N7451_012246 [Penicillium sp. IBT 35674x]
MGNVLRKATDSAAGYRQKLHNATRLKHEKSKAAKKLDPRIDSAHGDWFFPYFFPSVNTHWPFQVKRITPKSSARLPGQGTEDQRYDTLMDRAST